MAGRFWGAGRGADHDSRRRLGIIYSVFTLAFAVFIGWTLFLGVQGTDRTRMGPGSNSWLSGRADIVDRNGEILAKNVISGHIVLRPNKVQDHDRAAEALHEVVPEVSVAQALDYIRSDKKFIYIKKFASESQLADIKALRIDGLGTEETELRKYPKRRLFSHLVGFVGTDGHGLEGVEKTRDKYLSENNAPLALSVDSRIQTVFYNELSRAMQKYSARAAMGMLMNSRTGEMLAMVSLPDFDPEDKDADAVENRVFWPLRGVYEMGSIFKAFNTSMAMENGISLSKEYYIKEPFKVLGKNGQVSAVISDVATFKPPRPNLNIAEIMLYSCNVGSAQIALDLPSGVQPEFFERLHMNVPLDLEFGRTERPIMPAKWGPVEKATVAFGHGIAVTPMHVLLGINAVTNGGFYVWPTLSKRAVGEIKGSRVVSPEISDAIRKIMFKIAEESGGKSARVAGINIGGKTATAEKRINGKIDKMKNLTSFTAIFPIESPQYIMMVVLDEPKGTKETWGFRTAAWNSAPTAGAIMDSIMPMLFE